MPMLEGPCGRMAWSTAMVRAMGLEPISMCMRGLPRLAGDVLEAIRA